MTPTAARASNALLVALIAAAFVAAWVLRDSGLLSLSPPASPANPAPAPDAVGRELALYLSAFTAWAALLLLMPAYVFVWFSQSSARARDWWVSFWSVAFAAYAIHLMVSMFLFFGGDFNWMTQSSRVSAFWPGMIIALWWPFDLWLARTQADEVLWVRVERIMLHVVIFVLFVGGSAVMGELPAAKIIGLALFALGAVSFAQWAKRRYLEGKG